MHRPSALMSEIQEMSLPALVAGACALSVGLWNSGRSHSWLVSLHGLALGAFGLIGLSPLVKGPLSFRPVSLLFVVMAGSVGAFALATAQTLRNGGPDRWFLRLSGLASIAFAFSLMIVGLGRIRLEPPLFWSWMSSYFFLCAIFMLYLGLRVRSHGVPELGPREDLPPNASPRHAH